MTQLNMDFSVRHTASPTLQGSERRRLSTQNAAILARLQRGTATNRELAGLSLKYTSRLSDLRKAGNIVRVVSRDYRTGLTVYQLEDR